MMEMPQWLVITLASVVPIITIIGFWMSLASRLTKAETASEHAIMESEEANGKITIMSSAFALYREQIAREYIHREAMREVEDRLTQAIERLGDRLDRMFERSDRS